MQVCGKRRKIKQTDESESCQSDSSVAGRGESAESLGGEQSREVCGLLKLDSLLRASKAMERRLDFLPNRVGRGKICKERIDEVAKEVAAENVESIVHV